MVVASGEQVEAETATSQTGTRSRGVGTRWKSIALQDLQEVQEWLGLPPPPPRARRLMAMVMAAVTRSAPVKLRLER